MGTFGCMCNLHTADTKRGGNGQAEKLRRRLKFGGGGRRKTKVNKKGDVRRNRKESVGDERERK